MSPVSLDGCWGFFLFFLLLSCFILICYAESCRTVRRYSFVITHPEFAPAERCCQSQDEAVGSPENRALRETHRGSPWYYHEWKAVSSKAFSWRFLRLVPLSDHN